MKVKIKNKSYRLWFRGWHDWVGFGRWSSIKYWTNYHLGWLTLTVRKV